MQSPSPGSEKSLWCCPYCSGRLQAIAGALRCDGCGKDYPVVQGIPILLRDPVDYLRSELASLERAQRAGAQRRTAIDKDAGAAGLTETSVSRHRDVADTDIARVQELLALLKPTLDALKSLPVEQQKVPAKRSGWGFDSLFPYLLRDWSGTEELRAAAAIIGGAIADAFPSQKGKAIAFAGCGAAGVLDEIKLDFEHIIGFDLTFPI